MKGLLVKDFKLLKQQKNSLLYFLIIAFGLTLSTDNVSFIIGFFTFIFSLFSLGSISYDEFDNGNVFLFSLPFTRIDYVIEKYCFSLILGCTSWIFSTVLVIIIGLFKSNYGLSIGDIMTVAFMIIPFMLFTISIMFPFQLKFGGEKGRIVLICTFGFIFLLGIIIGKMAELFNIDISSFFNNLQSFSIKMLIFIAFIAAVVIFLVSIKISILIVKKKEF